MDWHDGERCRAAEAGAGEGDTFGNALYRIHVPAASMRAMRRDDGDGDGARAHSADDGDVDVKEDRRPHGSSDDPFGRVYFVTVEDTVSNLPEYVLPWNAFVCMCRQHDLHVILDEDFITLLDRPPVDASTGQTTTSKDELLELVARQTKRKRPDSATVEASSVGALLTDDEREAILLYRAFMLEKRSPQVDRGAAPPSTAVCTSSEE